MLIKRCQNLLRWTLGVINGTNDFKDKNQAAAVLGEDVDAWRGKSRYTTGDEHGRIVCDAKHQALLCVEALYNFVFNVRLRYLLCDFKIAHTAKASKGRSQGTKGRAFSRKGRGKAAEHQDQDREAELLKENYLDLLSSLAKDSVEFTDEMTDRVRSYLANVTKQSAWVTSKTWKLENGTSDSHGTDMSLVGVLVDLARYEDDRLLTKSMQLVDRIYSAENDLFDLAVQATVLLTKQSKGLLDLKDMLPELKRLGSRNIAGDDVKKFNDLICYMTSKCFWEPEIESKPDNILFGGRPYAECWENPGPTNATNQQIIFNSGALLVILNVIRREQPQSVLRNCFWFLRAACINRNEVQLILYESLDTILSTKTLAEMSEEDKEDERNFESWENSMGGTIYEIFNNCRETCLRVTADQVKNMLHRVGAGDAEKTFRTAKLLNALRAVAKGACPCPAIMAVTVVCSAVRC